MMRMPEHEHRSIPRWQVGNKTRLRLEESQEEKDCILHDINLKGARISWAGKFVKDAVIKLALYLSRDCEIRFEGWVVWQKAVGTLNIYGVYFSKISDADKEKIYRFLQSNFPGQMKKQWWEDITTEKGGIDMDDRRIFERLPAQLPLRFMDINQNAEGYGQTVDVSAKGLGMVVDRELPPYTPLEVWIKVAEEQNPLYTRGEVVWSQKVEPDKFRIGVDLEKADLMGMSRILRVI